jgi:hypothetical protein
MLTLPHFLVSFQHPASRSHQTLWTSTRTTLTLYHFVFFSRKSALRDAKIRFCSGRASGGIWGLSTTSEARICLYMGGDTCNIVQSPLDWTDAHLWLPASDLFCNPRTGANHFVIVVYPLRDSLFLLHDVIRRLTTDVTSPSFPPLYWFIIGVRLFRILVLTKFAESIVIRKTGGCTQHLFYRIGLQMSAKRIHPIPPDPPSATVACWRMFSLGQCRLCVGMLSF